MKSTLFSVFISLFLTVADAQSNNEGCVLIQISGLRVKTGTVYVSIYNDKELFLKVGKETRTNTISICEKDTLISTSMCSLSSGWYAVALYHDEDNNKRMNTGLLSIPLEPFGLSNNFHPRFSYPKFSQCSFYLRPTEEKSIFISLITPYF